MSSGICQKLSNFVSISKYTLLYSIPVAGNYLSQRDLSKITSQASLTLSQPSTSSNSAQNAKRTLCKLQNMQTAQKISFVTRIAIWTLLWFFLFPLLIALAGMIFDCLWGAKQEAKIIEAIQERSKASSED
jgi:hypothetical protein